ncbi:MAG: bifunctional proline dehydrogenase/L-glutamate gamma-semialdehyde dehydrogenase PutA [Burkholderiales bacterium]|nr:MAG: bifunctional proline dehydrogenase/L-glutamate gamma-semialdehyde dehydrogenase PutA [Burkholderiales bacterium]
MDTYRTDPFAGHLADPLLAQLRSRVRTSRLADESASLRALREVAALGETERARIVARATGLVEAVRARAEPGLMGVFLAEYGLSTREGVALMCLAEALLRVPDAPTIDALIEDKIAPSDWGLHLGHSSSSLVNASTWALLLTGKLLRDEPEAGEGALAAVLHGAVRRLGEPVIRAAVGRAMRELGARFVLGTDIDAALARARSEMSLGYTYSYDMLGEAARTDADARRYLLAYSRAITALAASCSGGSLHVNPAVSVKLSALHPRYEGGQRDRVLPELVTRVTSLAQLASSAAMGLNIDAEEADRLELSLDVIEAVLMNPALAGWDGFGVAVQSYAPRALAVIDWLHALAARLGRRITVRLVKGAYWDTEIKRAQVLGLPGFPVFTRKASSDLSYLACARRLLAMTDRIFPQFATHNAHTVAAVLHMAAETGADFEFQRLHGMGEALHALVMDEAGARCRIYAPVGAHRDLLAYLVRRLLENGANSSFVNQIVDTAVPARAIARDPLEVVAAWGAAASNPAILPAPALFGAQRRNSRGWDVNDPSDRATLEAMRERFGDHRWAAAPMLAQADDALPLRPAERRTRTVRNPARAEDVVGTVTEASAADVEAAFAAAVGDAARAWARTDVRERAACLRRAADLYEAHAGELHALAAREAGKTLVDCVGELREAVDFLRYYAAQAEGVGDAPPAGAAASDNGGGHGGGAFVCISPWNFPLAIFTGQVAAALAVGHAVIAKPAEQTALIAARAVQLLHAAGVPAVALQLLPGDGPSVGAALTADARVCGLCFTGSIETAHGIDRAMAEAADPRAPLIAETGGLNAMIVDSTALPEQAVQDIVASAFQSAGQRCSALRVLYLQRDTAPRLLEMLFGAIDLLQVGDPWDPATDLGPVIDTEARDRIEAHVARAAAEGRLLKRGKAPDGGLHVAPAVIRVAGIGELREEVFGPVLHVATFEADELDAVVDAVNASGYGLTFGLHTRIDARVQRIVERLRVGNVYVNRNQIGAVVGSQPFGGEGLSGTGPKAGGPRYLRRLAQVPRAGADEAGPVDPDSGESDAGAAPAALGEPAVQAALALLRRPPQAAIWAPVDMPGPTGESNRLSLHARGIVLCLGPGAQRAAAQAREALAAGCAALMAAPGAIAERAAIDAPPERLAAIHGIVPEPLLGSLRGFDAVRYEAGVDALRRARRALATRPGPILPLITGRCAGDRLLIERHLCIDTTAAGGNAALLAGAA